MLPSIDATNNRAVYSRWADQLKVVGGRTRTNIGSGTARIGNYKIVKVQSRKEKNQKIINQYNFNVGIEKVKIVKLITHLI
jgi:hypothetical protein